MTEHPWQGWSNYDDMGHVLELGAVFDDALKKNKDFLAYSVMLANRICEDLAIKCKVTWGKWGGRLEPKENQRYSEAELQGIADKIIKHPSWIALQESTRVFTYGKRWDE